MGPKVTFQPSLDCLGQNKYLHGVPAVFEQTLERVASWPYPKFILSGPGRSPIQIDHVWIEQNTHGCYKELLHKMVGALLIL